MSVTMPTVDPVVGANSIDSNVGIGRATKKVRTRTDLTFEFDDPLVDSNGKKVLPEGPKPSYKSTLIGESFESICLNLEEEKFSLLDGDAVMELIDGVPFITFSNRVQ